MTLVMTLLTPYEVVQVSDRKTVRGGRAEDDERNKAVVILARNMSFAYSGLGDLGPDGDTTLWLTSALHDAAYRGGVVVTDHGVILGRLRERLDATFGSPPISGFADRRHSVVCAGWAHFQGGELEPYCAVLSNCLVNERSVSPARDRFELATLRLGGAGGHEVWETPRRDDTDLEILWRHLGTLNDAYKNTEVAVTALIEHVRKVADRDPDVGRDLMVTVLPRPTMSPEAQMMVLGGDGDTPSFHYVPADGTDGVAYGPAAVSAGFVVSGFKMTPLPPETG